MESPKQQNLDDVPQCLRELADAIEADPKMAEISTVVLLRDPSSSPALQVYGFGKGEKFSEDVFTECHIAAKQMLDLMTDEDE